MNPEENSIELIDRYLSGGLSAEEKYDFEERLRIDKEFRERFNIQKVSYKIIIIQSLLDLKERMQKDLSGNTYKINIFFPWKYYESKVLSLVLIIVLCFVLKKEKPK